MFVEKLHEVPFLPLNPLSGVTSFLHRRLLNLSLFLSFRSICILFRTCTIFFG
ncbi:hypothetical protein HanIR_Chr12g0586811 [Helianthus annuus]|nr:hypothetical protein HanIR_Chr12g0586811 [Helianthus annuus]